MWIFAAGKASLVVIYIMVVKNIFFFNVTGAVIGRYSEIYSLEINAKPATKDINCILTDVGRDLPPCLLPTEPA